jgi:hypothetical protein
VPDERQAGGSITSGFGGLVACCETHLYFLREHAGVCLRPAVIFLNLSP